MSAVLVVAPHPDDETLGCGGTLLRHADEGDTLHWLIVTDMTAEGGFGRKQMARRDGEINAVAEAYGFATVERLGFATARLDTVPMDAIVDAMYTVFEEVRPDTVYLPFPGDAHTDHQISFQAASACTKPFRSGSVRKVMCMEIPSETNFKLAPGTAAFWPNHYVDIGAHLDRKLEIMRLYEGELGKFPFPRSEQAIGALAQLRGVEAGCSACEGFQILRAIR